jgi:hypothetical protein
MGAQSNLPLIVRHRLAEAKASLRAGANVLVHSVEDLPVDAEFMDLAKKNGTIVIPTLVVLDGYVRMFRGVVDRKPPVVDDPNGCVDRATLAKVAETAALDTALVPADRMAAREQRAAGFTKVTRANLKALIDAGIPIATGTDAGNPLTLPARHLRRNGSHAGLRDDADAGHRGVDGNGLAGHGSRQADRHDRERQRCRPRRCRRRSVVGRRESAQDHLRGPVRRRQTDCRTLRNGAISV